MTLHDIAAEEERLVRIVEAASGTFEERVPFLERHGVFDAYAIVYRRYVELALEGDIEALKRALFLQWYVVAEPYELTGLSDADEATMVSVLRAVNRRVVSGDLDAELRWMLPWYFMIADWYLRIDSTDVLEELGPFIALSRSQSSDIGAMALDAAAFLGRGTMGYYWASVIDATRDPR